MLAPLSWLKEYIDIKLSPRELGERLTEVGLGCEKILKTKDDTIFELEITPNRPDWLSIIGVAREVAAIENTPITYPTFKTDLKPKHKTTILPLTIHPNYDVTPRLTGIIINNVTIKPSPQWLQDKLLSIGQRPISNIVDITNYVMFELGNPIHSFDYYKIDGHEMWVKQAKGGEQFESVDDISYHLPKGAIIYEDTKKIFDLVGIKGGKNSGTYKDTKAVFIVVEVDDPVLIRKASQRLALRSEASAIFERAVNRGGTIDALKRTVDLILETAGGEIASELIDIKKQDFTPWKLTLRLDRLAFVLGVTIPTPTVVELLNRLHLNPKLDKETIACTIPTYRNDLQIEEDLIEEVARLYGYNNFPKTLPTGAIPTEEIPHFKDYHIFDKAKEILIAGGFSEIYTYSLLNEKDIIQDHYDVEKVIRVDNPISREYEYLRPSLLINLKKAFNQNKTNFKHVSLFELGKVYSGKTLETASEPYELSGITNELSVAQVKGLLERIFDELRISETPYTIALDGELVIFSLNFSIALENRSAEKVFVPVPKYPSISEDLTFEITSPVKIGDVINEIKKQSPLIMNVSLPANYHYNNAYTFHIIYQDSDNNLTNEKVSEIRGKIIKHLSTKLDAKVK